MIYHHRRELLHFVGCSLLWASCESFISPMFDLMDWVIKWGTDDVDCVVSNRAIRVLSIAPSPRLLSVSIEPLSSLGPQPAINNNRTEDRSVSPDLFHAQKVLIEL
jgi:hypothetical protein